MSQTIEGQEFSITDLEAIRSQQHDILKKDAGNGDAICELVCADALLCEEYAGEQGADWRNAALCREISHYVPAILEIPDRVQVVANVCERAAYYLYHHPRLKVELLELQREAVELLGGQEAEEAEMGIDDISAEIMRLQLNIIAADQEHWEAISNVGHLRHDPVEWTEAYENVISEAQAKAEAALKDQPRGMGFCFAWWHTLAQILRDDYGITWRSPQQMNPGVIFD